MSKTYSYRSVLVATVRTARRSDRIRRDARKALDVARFEKLDARRDQLKGAR